MSPEKKKFCCSFIVTVILCLTLNYGYYSLDIKNYFHTNHVQIMPEPKLPASVPDLKADDIHTDDVTLSSVNTRHVINNNNDKSSLYKKLGLYLLAGQPMQGLYILNNVCLEKADRPYYDPYLINSIPDRHIVVYESDFEETKPMHTRCEGNVPEMYQYWHFHFRKSSIPSNRRMIPGQIAYFISTTCPGNFHHFWYDYFARLYGVLDFTQQLNTTVGHQVFYRQPLWEMTLNNNTRYPWDYGCYTPFTYETILETLPIVNHMDYQKAEINSCYGTGVFGTPKYRDMMQLRQYVLDRMNLGELTCQPKRVIFIQRKSYRKILNIQMLVQAAKANGFDNSEIVVLEDLTVEAQMKKMLCTDILIGVQGAGLNWLHFMKTNGGLIEIVWQGWPKYYDKWSFNGLRGVSIIGTEVPNSDHQEILRKDGKYLNEKELKKVLQQNAHKYSDVTVGIMDFMEKFKEVSEHVLNNKH